MTAYHCIIVGGGLAAFQLAKYLHKEKQVLLVTKGNRTMSNSYRAQGGIAAVMAKDDHPSYHFEDTMQAGCSFHNEEQVMALVHQGPELIQSLEKQGLQFDKNKNGTLSLGMEGAHSRKRIVHCGGDATGKHVMDHLQTTIGENVKVIENEFVYELIICSTTQNCIGIKVKDSAGNGHHYYAQQVVLATGGLGGLYHFTSNDSSITGDGLALASLAGAELADMEFIQFHPTLLYVNGVTKGLVSEAVRGEGAQLITSNGRLLMEGKHPLVDLAPRHIVAKAIYEERIIGNDVFLDISMIQQFEQKFPTIAALCKEHGVSLQEGKIPVAPGCHFLMGGILVNAVGETSIKGLFAVGETAMTGVHGANRLASNSLLEGLYYGQKIAAHLNALEEGPLHPTHERVTINLQEKKQIILPDKTLIQQKMMYAAGIIRTEDELEQLVEWLNQYEQINESLDDYDTEVIQRLFMIQVAKVVVRSALARKESRGAHQRADYWESDEAWQDVHLIHSKKGMEKRKLYEHHQVEVYA